MSKRQLFAFIIGMSLFCQGYAVAPVVDESEHFADEEKSFGSLSRSSTDDTPIAKSMPEDRSQKTSLAEQIRVLQQDIQELRGELEIQGHTVDELKQQFKQSIQSAQQPPLSSTASAVMAPSESSASLLQTAPLGNPADEQVAYLAAYDLVKSKQYDAALKAMQSFSNRYPSGGYTANAEYWMGELYLVKNQPREAIQHFDVVLNRFPNSSKAAASSLKTAYALSALGKKEEAIQHLKEVIKNYPDTAAAQLAKSKLESISSLH